jgi:protease-4
MFSRRHPYLFFIIIFSSIAAVFIISVSVLFVLGSGGSSLDFREKVGVVEITGVIKEARSVINSLKQFRKDDSIKAIVLRIDSPGGGVGPSQEIYREVQKTVKMKKVVASMGAIATSGGYYVAAGADGIVANPGTITGSIGVIMGFTNFEAVLKKIGLIPIVIKSGEYKDTGSPVRPMSSEERKMLQQLVDKIHSQFVKDVASGRNLDQKKVEMVADGRIFSGQDAITYGLVDRLGNFEDAIEWAGRLGGITGEISTVYAKEKKLPLLQYLLDSSISTIMDRIETSRMYGGYLYQP